MIFAKMCHDKSAPAGGFTHTLFTKDFDPPSLLIFLLVLWVCEFVVCVCGFFLPKTD